jgi:glycosyltransferase involved in cell wall biosynthesis
VSDKPYLLVAGDFRQTGGMDQANWALASYLARRGRPVHLVGFSAADDLIAYPNVYFKRVSKVARSYFISGPRLRKAGIEAAARVAASGGRVVVNGGNCQWPGVNWVHYVHAAFRPRTSTSALHRMTVAARHWVFRREEAEALKKSRLIIANSNGTKRALIELLHLPEEKIETIYYGCAPDRFYPADHDERQGLREQAGIGGSGPVFAYAGSLGDVRKGFDSLYSAWRTLCARASWPGTLVVIGSGSEAAAWRARSATDGLNARIRFLGFRTDIASLFRFCDALLLPARYEPFGLVVQEALCCGVPAIVSRNAGVAEIYPPELEPLVVSNPEDVEELARTLAHLNQHLARYRDAALGFAATLRRYTWDDMARRMVERIEAPA